MDQLQNNNVNAPITPNKAPITTVDRVCAWLLILVGFAFARALPTGENTLGGVLFFVLLFGFGIVYLLRAGVTLKPSAYVFAALACLASLGLVTSANRVLGGFTVFFLLVAFFYWVYSSCGLKSGAIFDEKSFAYAIEALIVLPLSYIDRFFPALSIGAKRGKRLAHGLLWALCGLAFAIIPTVIIFFLLSFDEGFVKLVDDLIPSLSDEIWEIVGDAFVGAVFAVLFFASLFGAKSSRARFGGAPKELKLTDTHFVPRPLICAAVTPILLLYVIFFVSQWDWYISAFTHRLPESLTYADYARNGFFQLCWVSAINAAMLLVFNLFIRRADGRRDPVRVIYSSVISLSTLVLIATALAKMLLYIDSYGLTRKRVYASWLMLLLAAIFIVTLLCLFIRRIPLAATVIAVCIVFFAGISLPNVDGAIADYNVDAYLSGELSDVDVASISEYGASAVPALVRLRDSLGEGELKTETELALSDISKELAETPGGLFSFNIPRARARKLLSTDNP